jgi:hypothetical protein
MKREIAERTARTDREEGRWHTTKFGSKSGVIGIRRRATSITLPKSMGVGEAICTRREVVAVVNRPQDIEDEEAMAFFGGEEGDADESQG